MALDPPPDGRVNVATSDGPLVANPTWTRLDDTDNLVAGIDIDRGKQDENSQTNTGTATVYANDTAGLLEAAGTDLVGCQIALGLYNPVTASWEPQFRGVVDDIGSSIRPSQVVCDVQLACVDMFDYLGGAGMSPGIDGTTPPAGSEGTIFYAAANVDDRIKEILTDALIPSDLWVVFTGNVTVQDSKYDPDEAFLIALRDAADAEFPTIANIYIDPLGRFVFHGRDATFHPATVAAGATPGAWDFNTWNLGDGAAILADATRVQIRELAFNRPRSQIVNAALAYPIGIAEADIPGQVVVDAVSIAAYGKHSWSAPGLRTLAGTTTGNGPNAETKLYATYRVENFKDPRTRVSTVTVKAVRPDDDRASVVWDYLCRADISDLVNVDAGYPGGVGFDADFYLEGVHTEIRPLQPGYDMVTKRVDLSPAAYWGTDVFV
jgi:hypothetical protein